MDSFTVCQNPVKLYEYLAAGLPIVSTALPELEPYRDFVLSGNGPEACSACLAKARREERPDRVLPRQQAARENRWTARAEEAAALITAHLEPR